MSLEQHVAMPTILELHDKAEDVSRILSALSNPRRLVMLCHLLQHGETSVSALVDVIGVSQSALSQHLAMMRAEGLVRARKEGLSVYYSIADSRIKELVSSLERIFCGTQAG